LINVYNQLLTLVYTAKLNHVNRSNNNMFIVYVVILDCLNIQFVKKSKTKKIVHLALTYQNVLRVKWLIKFLFSDTAQLYTYGYMSVVINARVFFMLLWWLLHFPWEVWGWIFIMNFGNPGCWCPFCFFPTSTLLRTTKIYITILLPYYTVILTTTYHHHHQHALLSCTL